MNLGVEDEKEKKNVTSSRQVTVLSFYVIKKKGGRHFHPFPFSPILAKFQLKRFDSNLGKIHSVNLVFTR